MPSLFVCVFCHQPLYLGLGMPSQLRNTFSLRAVLIICCFSSHWSWDAILAKGTWHGVFLWILWTGLESRLRLWLGMPMMSGRQDGKQSFPRLRLPTTTSPDEDGNKTIPRLIWQTTNPRTQMANCFPNLRWQTTRSPDLDGKLVVCHLSLGIVLLPS